MGRAGRDGLPSACHLLLQREDAILQHSLSHSMELSRIQIAALLMKVFQLSDAAPTADRSDMRGFLSQFPLQPQVSLLLEPLEATMDISSTVVETIMSVLELPPYNLVVIEGTHFDTIKGRFRMSAEALAKEDILVAALVACNTYKSPKSGTDIDFAGSSSSSGGGRAGGDGMSDAYGLGLDSSASASNRGVIGEDSTGLYKLQKSGVLEYKLQDSALYVRALPTAHTSSAHHFEVYCRASAGNRALTPPELKQRYFEWVWQVADAVHGSLLKIAVGGSHRIVDMWKATSTIAHFTARCAVKTLPAPGIVASKTESKGKAAEVEGPRLSPASVHSAAQSLLGYVISDADGGTAGSDVGAENSLDREMLNLYLSTPGPFELSLHAPEPASTTAKDAGASVIKLRSSVRNGVNVLQRDPSMLTAVNTILKSCVGLLTHQSRLDVTAQSDGGQHAPSVQYAKKELLALCMCRVLHALPTRLLPAIAWRDRSDAWGSFKNVEFEALYAYILEQLTTVGK
jgi:hypothetical protein